MSSDEDDSPTAPANGPKTPQEWKKWKEEKKQLKRKWKEEKMLNKIERKKAREEKEKQQVLESAESLAESESKGIHYTVSMALPGSILDNAQTPELRSYLAAQIARAAVVFNIDEIVVFDELATVSRTEDGELINVGKKVNCNLQLARILQYLECPQYLRKPLFPQHPDLRYAGLLNPLDTPHHMKASEECEFREGIVLDKPVKPGKGSFVNVGLFKEVQIDKALRTGLRVTVRMGKYDENKSVLQGTAVSPLQPRQQKGLYWGYQVRVATSLGAVFTECPYRGGYDCLIGTSERGKSVDTFTMPQFKHMLLVFGGVKGLESSLDADQILDMDDPSLLFHHYLNTCPGQGSHTIRTEEAILITLAALRPKINTANIKT